MKYQRNDIKTWFIIRVQPASDKCVKLQYFTIVYQELVNIVNFELNPKWRS